MTLFKIIIEIYVLSKQFAMKIFQLLFIFLISCKQSHQDKITSIRNENLEPTTKKINKMEVGESFVFESLNRSGINPDSYEVITTYETNIDTTFFKYQKSETINDGTDGGYSTTFRFYKAIKKGKTVIEEYKIETSTKRLKMTIENHDSIMNIKPIKTLELKYEFKID